jgi:chitodextrinase
MVKIVDNAVPAAAPTVQVEAPGHAAMWDDVKLAASADPKGVPALSYRWDFGDGTMQQGRRVSHSFDKAGKYTVRLKVEGVDGIPAEKEVTITVNGEREIGPPTRYEEQETNTVRQ